MMFFIIDIRQTINIDFRQVVRRYIAIPTAIPEEPFTSKIRDSFAGMTSEFFRKPSTNDRLLFRRAYIKFI